MPKKLLDPCLNPLVALLVEEDQAQGLLKRAAVAENFGKGRFVDFERLLDVEQGHLGKVWREDKLLKNTRIQLNCTLESHFMQGLKEMGVLCELFNDVVGNEVRDLSENVHYVEGGR